MICKPCAYEADEGPLTETGKANIGHSQCKGCDCQHLPVREGQIKNG